MVTTERLLTGEEFLAMGEMGSCELVEGRIVPTMAPGADHGAIEVDLATDLNLFVRAHKIGKVAGGEVGIFTGRNPDTVRMADLVFISQERLDRLPRGYLEVAPELVVEVVSPTNTWTEMRDKISEYFAIGVDRIWLVEPERRSVLVYSSPSEFVILSEGDTVRGEGILTGFSLPVAAIFQD